MRTETYENCTFTRFRSLIIEFIEDFFSEKVIHRRCTPLYITGAGGEKIAADSASEQS